MSVILTSNNTNKHYGIEVASSLSWEHWEPGGEYTKQITLKNVNLKTKKLKYRYVFMLLPSKAEPATSCLPTMPLGTSQHDARQFRIGTFW